MDTHDFEQTPDGLVMNRRSVLKCVATWAGTGVVWALVGGVPRAFAANAAGAMAAAEAGASNFNFVQISDSHIGFNKAANPEPLKTLQVAIDRINAVPAKPSFILHTGDITHLSKVEEFDTAAQVLKGLPYPIHYVPGEHDTLDEGGGKLFLDRYGKGTKGNGWYSFDDHGVHFVALVNVFNLEAGHEAKLGGDQLKWLAEQELIASHIRSLQDGHLTDVISTDQHTVKPWFNGRLDISPPVNDFAASGFPLIGGRLDYVDHHTVAVIVYRYNKHVINLFVWPAGGPDMDFGKVSAQQGYNMRHWHDGDLQFWAVSDVNPAKLAEFEDLYRGQKPKVQ